MIAKPKTISAMLPWAIAASVILYLFYPALFLGKTFFFRDIHRFFYPMKYALASASHAGVLPLWRHDIFCGSPLAGDIMTGVFYPPSLVFLLSPFHVAFNIFVISHVAIAFGLFFFFIRSLGMSHQAATLMSLSYAFGGYAISSLNVINHLSTLAWIPGILGAWVRAENSGHIASYLWVVGFLALGILGGAPQLIVFVIGMLACRIIIVSPKELLLRRSSILSGIVIFAVGICFVQLVLTYNDYLISIRSGGISYDEATQFSMSWKMLVHLVTPLRFPPDFIQRSAVTDLFPGDGSIPWLLTVYPGLLVVPLALFGLCRRFSRNSVYWLLIFTVSLLMALGNHTPLFRLSYLIFPAFRFPEKFMFPAGIALLVLAAGGWDALRERIHNGFPGSHVFFPIVLMVMAFDLCSAHRYLTPFCDPDFYRSRSAATDRLPAETVPYRIYSEDNEGRPETRKMSILESHARWQYWMMPNLGVINGVQHIGGTTGMELIHQYFITEVLGRPWSEKIWFLQSMNVRFVLSEQRLEEIPEIEDQLEKIGHGLYRLRDLMPRAWLTGYIAPLGQNIVEGLTERSPIDGLIHGPADLAGRWHRNECKPVEKVIYGPNRIAVEATAERPFVLFISEAFHPGWRVRVDGQERPCLRLHYLFMGVELEAGAHRIEFFFQPKHMPLWAMISVFSVMVLLVAAWATGYRRKGRDGRHIETDRSR